MERRDESLPTETSGMEASSGKGRTPLQPDELKIILGRSFETEDFFDFVATVGIYRETMRIHSAAVERAAVSEHEEPESVMLQLPN